MAGGRILKRNEHWVIVACRIMEAELDMIRGKRADIEIRYLDQGLHRTPQNLVPFVQEQIDQVAQYSANVVLGYGLCSNGIVGVTARRQGLIVPRCHDCITLFLGSNAAYRDALKTNPGTYYLTPGWIAEEKDPLSIIEKEYTARCGRDTAIWAMQEELKHYSRIVLIDTGATDLAPLRARAMENARFLGKEYQEVRGSLEYLFRIIQGPYTHEDFLFIKPGETITQAMFLGPCFS